MAQSSRESGNTHAMVAFGMLALLVLVMLFVSVIPHAGYLSVPGLTGKPTAVDAQTFPDAAFREYVSTHVDIDGDGYLSVEEVSGVKSIGRYDQGTYAVTETGLANAGVQSLQGMSVFYNLESLVASGNNISDFDMSGNPSLKYVDLRNNPSFSIGYTESNAGAQLLVSQDYDFWGDTGGLNIVVVEE